MELFDEAKAQQFKLIAIGDPINVYAPHAVRGISLPFGCRQSRMRSARIKTPRIKRSRVVVFAPADYFDGNVEQGKIPGVGLDPNEAFVWGD